MQKIPILVKEYRRANCNMFAVMKYFYKILFCKVVYLQFVTVAFVNSRKAEYIIKDIGVAYKHIYLPAFSLLNAMFHE